MKKMRLTAMLLAATVAITSCEETTQDAIPLEQEQGEISQSSAEKLTESIVSAKSTNLTFKTVSDISSIKGKFKVVSRANSTEEVAVTNFDPDVILISANDTQSSGFNNANIVSINPDKIEFFNGNNFIGDESLSKVNRIVYNVANTSLVFRLSTNGNVLDIINLSKRIAYRFEALTPNNDSQDPNGDQQDSNGDEQGTNEDQQDPNGEEQDTNEDQQDSNGDQQNPNEDEQNPNGDQQDPNTNNNQEEDPVSTPSDPSQTFSTVRNLADAYGSYTIIETKNANGSTGIIEFDPDELLTAKGSSQGVDFNFADQINISSGNIEFLNNSSSLGNATLNQTNRVIVFEANANNSAPTELIFRISKDNNFIDIINAVTRTSYRFRRN